MNKNELLWLSADWVVTKYVNREVRKVRARLDEELKNDCLDSLIKAVNNINSWIEFLDKNGTYPRYKIDENRELVVVKKV